MPNNVVHFAIHADDIERARRFYERVFGWRFDAWGPPDFYQIVTGTDDDSGIHGALHGRHVPVTDRGMSGFQCTIAVESITDAVAAIERHGGRIVTPENEIPGVGRHAGFEDTEGNQVAVMQYEHRP